ncbi:hypothetical protein MMC13_006785 [Lambiella insularis]|nr:hypothetical protein [Lambiella insularis]
MSALNGTELAPQDTLQHQLSSGKFYEVLISSRAQAILGHEAFNEILHQEDWEGSWTTILHQIITEQLGSSTSEESSDARQALQLVGAAALNAFLQSNVTGPPLDWNPVNVIFPHLRQSCQKDHLRTLRHRLIDGLTVDGVATYKLTAHIELFVLAKTILNHKAMLSNGAHSYWQRLRVNFWHQRMLSEAASTLQQEIYNDLSFIDAALSSPTSEHDPDTRTRFFLERAAIHIYHGFDTRAREDLDLASKLTGLEYELTGRLGKRTKFQQNELSQLVVLAKSADTSGDKAQVSTNGHAKGHSQESRRGVLLPASKPANLDLNDDTLLESIKFSKIANEQNASVLEGVPSSLAALDPANQPALKPYDSIILLSLASSITNMSPQHGLTREETLPYANRVLEGGSTNWQIYSQALLVRSRIEGYRSRTVERGVLQLQALVDQVITETSLFSDGVGNTEDSNASAIATSDTFLPRPKPSESAPVTERLEYIHQLASPTRWVLEAELAARWVSIGSLRTALEIYERLQMWAEVALCWAAVEREDKAIRVVRRQLYQSSSSRNSEKDDGFGPSVSEEVTDDYLGKERLPLPTDAPRLFCILGDLEKSHAHYERAWAVSKHRYARAQRSLGKHYTATQQMSKADEAYSESLKINPQNQSTWFALGCIRLELREWQGAVEAFSRAVQIEEGDAEAWSNLAAALLRLPPERNSSALPEDSTNDTNGKPRIDLQKHSREAFVALKKAAGLKRDSYRIWQNLLNVSATLSPPPFADIVTAQERLIELRGSVEGESCIDIEVLEGLLAHVIAIEPSPARSSTAEDETSPAEQRRKTSGLEHMFVDLMQRRVLPLITHSRRLWQLVARLSLYLNRWSSALEAYEKAWRVTHNTLGWESGTDRGEGSGSETSEQAWKSVVDATVELVDAYESLGEKERTEGLAAGTGELVCKEWKFKSRSAIRGVMGKAKERWENSEGWERLKEHLVSLRAS